MQQGDSGGTGVVDVPRQAVGSHAPIARRTSPWRAAVGPFFLAEVKKKHL